MRKRIPRLAAIAGNFRERCGAGDQFAHAQTQLSSTFRGQQHQVSGLRCEPFGTLRRIGLRRYIFFQGHVKIRAAKTERADRGAARVIAGANPWTAFGIEIERALFNR